MKTILVAIDFSDATHPVIESAVALARALPAKLVLTHVVPPAVIVTEYSPVVERLALEGEESARERLARWQAELEVDGLTVEACSLYGQPSVTLSEEAIRRDADYLVVGSHGHGAWYDLVVGSTAHDLLKRAPCPVLVVPVRGLKPAAAGVASRAPAAARPGPA